MKNTIINLVSGASLLLGVSTSVDIEKELLNKNNIPIDLYQKNYYTNNMINENLIYNFANLTNLIEDGSKNKDAVENKVYINDETFKIKMEEKRIQEELEKQLELERLTELERQKQIKLAEEKKKLEELNKQSSNWMTFHATYYTAKCKGCSGITKLEIDVRNTIYYKGYRIIAVDPRIIPLGSLVEVKTPHETFTAFAGDIGGAIKGRKIDILVKTSSHANTLGRHDVKLRVIKKGE